MAERSTDPDTPPEAPAAGITEEAIRRRAHEISESDTAGTPEENWLRAEQELSAAGGEADPPAAS